MAFIIPRINNNELFYFCRNRIAVLGPNYFGICDIAINVLHALVGRTLAVRFIPKNFKDLFQLASTARSNCAVSNKILPAQFETWRLCESCNLYFISTRQHNIEDFSLHLQ
jgi:hypothetical protein